MAKKKISEIITEESLKKAALKGFAYGYERRCSHISLCSRG